MAGVYALGVGAECQSGGVLMGWVRSHWLSAWPATSLVPWPPPHLGCRSSAETELKPEMTEKTWTWGFIFCHATGQECNRDYMKLWTDKERSSWGLWAPVSVRIYTPHLVWVFRNNCNVSWDLLNSATCQAPSEASFLCEGVHVVLTRVPAGKHRDSHFTEQQN